MHKKYDELQCQIDDRLYIAIVNYCQLNGISEEYFAEKVHTSPYIFQKALDRKIMMHVHETLISNIKKFLGMIKDDEE